MTNAHSWRDGVLAASLVASTLVTGCAKRSAVPVTIDGSSTVFPISEAVNKEFSKMEGTPTSLRVSGTSGGFKKFCAGEVDILGASRPIKPAESEPCGERGVEYIELPIAYDGLTIVVNPNNSWAGAITVDELRRIWEPDAQGKVVRWSQVRSEWPDNELHLFGAGAESGTYDYFTRAIVGREHSSRTDYSSSEDDNTIVHGVASDPLALGFVGYAYYLQKKAKLRALPVDDGVSENGAGPVAPMPATVQDGSYQPLSRPLFLYVAASALERPEVATFVNFYLERGRHLVGQVGYIPLPSGAYALGLERVSARRTGSLFRGKGSQVGLTIERLMQQEAEW